MFYFVGECDWGKCPLEDHRKRFGYIDEMSQEKKPIKPAVIKTYGRIEMEVNGISVTERSNMGGSCFALQHEENGTPSHIWQPNKDGKYEIRARIIDAENYAYIRFSSFILF